MHYFSGFCFRGEKWLFDWILKPYRLYNIAGFSYGAINALEFAYKQVKQGLRVQKLFLISPCMLAFKSKAFKRLQILSYQKDPALYVRSFLQNIGWNSLLDLNPNLARFTHLGSLEDLKILLEYTYSAEKLAFLCNEGISISVFLGLKDNLLDVKEALHCFKPYASVWQLKGANHLLQKPLIVY
ncbi:pimelyl-ACP methyl ester esterase BioV [Helicobacter suis]|uniref:pimelyl-ACP methyl ester esterase BioV n=1 Tax=Helicobacter suis TaxID=104628 RepID=UPI0013D2BAD1|nr:pimelyl-ACP methyl ester esterase BioV [Helicobacter suis]